MNYKIFAVATIAVLSACASTVPMKIVSAPKNRNGDQRQLDNIECSNASHAEAPLLFGVGPVLAKNRSAKLYTECMKEKGYVVRIDEHDDEDRKSAPSQSIADKSKEATASCNESYKDSRLDPIRDVIAISSVPTLSQQSNANFIENSQLSALDAYSELLDSCRNKLSAANPQLWKVMTQVQPLPHENLKLLYDKQITIGQFNTRKQETIDRVLAMRASEAK